jgi:F1F0 ATPase subunit 2
MMDIVPLAMAMLAGIVIGGFYFGSLWLVVRRVRAMRYPAAWLLVSFVARTVIAAAGFYFVMGGRWERIATCMLGFLLARTILVRWFHPAKTAATTG